MAERDPPVVNGWWWSRVHATEVGCGSGDGDAESGVLFKEEMEIRSRGGVEREESGVVS